MKLIYHQKILNELTPIFLGFKKKKNKVSIKNKKKKTIKKINKKNKKSKNQIFSNLYKKIESLKNIFFIFYKKTKNKKFFFCTTSQKMSEQEL